MLNQLVVTIKQLTLKKLKLVKLFLHKLKLNRIFVIEKCVTCMYLKSVWLVVLKVHTSKA